MEVDEFVEVLSRKEIIQKSLDNYGYILVADTMQDAIDTVNEIASEHLELVTKNPFETMTKIPQRRGEFLFGEYSSEPLGDYFAGPNHVLPTNGTAKFFSPLSVDDFIKKSSIISYSREALKPVYKDIVQFAECEKLTAHANSIRVRLKINCIYSAPIRKTALSELSFCSCGYFAKEIFKIMLIHASMIRKFMKIALALNRYKELIIT